MTPTLDNLVTYLRLSPEFGGTRFGPFESLEVRLGSDPNHCHVVIDASLGVQPDHVKLIQQVANSWTLSPSVRTAAVFLWSVEAERAVEVTTPSAVSPGDSFSLVTRDGPRFIVELDELPEKLKLKRRARLLDQQRRYVHSHRPGIFARIKGLCTRLLRIGVVPEGASEQVLTLHRLARMRTQYIWEWGPEEKEILNHDPSPLIGASRTDLERYLGAPNPAPGGAPLDEPNAIAWQIGDTGYYRTGPTLLVVTLDDSGIATKIRWTAM